MCDVMYSTWFLSGSFYFKISFMGGGGGGMGCIAQRMAFFLLTQRRRVRFSAFLNVFREKFDVFIDSALLREWTVQLIVGQTHLGLVSGKLVLQNFKLLKISLLIWIVLRKLILALVPFAAVILRSTLLLLKIKKKIRCQSFEVSLSGRVALLLKKQHKKYASRR